MQESDFQAKSILSSVLQNSQNFIHTLQLRYPRIIHSEFMTHRVFSRNARSSRAVPVKKLLEEEIYVPHFLKNKPGMQATEEFSKEELLDIKWAWIEFAQKTQEFSKFLAEKVVHKQHANRPLEWFGYIDVVVTSDKWDNFFALRLHKDAQPEIRMLAIEMDKEIKKVISEYEFNVLKHGQWHLPYVTDEEKKTMHHDYALKLSVARCARVSYAPFDGNASHEKEFERADLLLKSNHMSPFEHQAYIGEFGKDYHSYDYDHQRNTYRFQNNLKSNFDFPWVQYRKVIELYKDRPNGHF